VSGLRLVLVRHGITDWNREGRFQGHLDPPLSDVGRHEAALVAARVADDPSLRPARIVSSSLTRALETAQAIGAACDLPVAPDARLMEIGQGEWEGRTHAEIARTDAARYEVWRTTDGLPPGGESIESTMSRLSEALAEAVGGEGSVALVTHGGTIRVLARMLFALSPTRSWALDVDNASISVAERAGDAWRLERWNDTGHLLGVEPTHVDEAEGRPLAL
jgi:broad specificity phosphatase PhoE